MLLFDNYLYEKSGDGNKILGYLMTPKFPDIRAYKERELGPIIKGSGVLEATSNFSLMLEYVINNKEISVSCFDLIRDDNDYLGCNNIHTLRLDDDIEHSQEIISRYYNGGYSTAWAVMIRKRFSHPTISLPTDYLLLTEPKYSITSGIFNNYSNYKMPGIIPIPEALYYLQMLENGHFENIGDTDIEEQLGLFAYQTVPSLVISMETLEQSLKGGLTERETFEKAQNKVKESNKILQLVRKYTL